MEDIVKQVAERANLPEDVAEKAVEVIVDVLKDRLPAPIGSQIEELLSGESDLGDLAGGLGNLFGG